MAMKKIHKLGGSPAMLAWILVGLRGARIVSCSLLRLVAALCVAASMSGCLQLPPTLFEPDRKWDEARLVRVQARTIDDAIGKVAKQTKRIQELRPAEERPELWTGGE